MSDTFREALQRALVVSSSRFGLTVVSLPELDDEWRWDVLDGDKRGGILSSSGEVYTLELAGRYTFYAFEYDGSFEIVQELVEVIQEYLAGNYLLRHNWFGRTRLVIQAAGSVWEGVAKA